MFSVYLVVELIRLVFSYQTFKKIKLLKYFLCMDKRTSSSFSIHSIRQSWSESYLNQTEQKYFTNSRAGVGVNISRLDQTKSVTGNERFIENSFAQNNFAGSLVNSRMLNNCQGNIWKQRKKKFADLLFRFALKTLL